MAERRKALLLSGAAVAAALLGPGAGDVGAVEIGSVAAANREVLGTPPAEATRPLLLGARVVLDERIQTSELGAGQFMFLDQTALTVWPNSDVVLDEYVYDPARSSGRAAFSATRGMLRFIGGRISKTEDVTIRTPHSVVAVRGGMAQITVSDSRTLVVHIAGERTRVGNLVLSRPMAMAEVSTADPTPRFIGIADAGTVNALYGGTLGRGTGGLAAPPQAAMVDTVLRASGLPVIGSADRRAPRERPVSTRGEREPVVGEAQVRLNVDQTQQVVVDVRTPAVAAPPPDPGNPPPPPDPGNRPPPPDPDVPPPSDPWASPPAFEIVTPFFTPSTVPVSPAPAAPALPVGPVAGVTGALFRAVDAEGGNRVFAGDPPPERFLRAARYQPPGAYPVLSAFTASDGLNFLEIPGFHRFPAAGDIDGRPADMAIFVDPGVFALSAFRTVGAGPDDLALGFIGVPTPQAVFDTDTGSDLTVSVFGLGTDLFSGASGPLPPQSGNAGTSLGDLLLIPGPDAPLLPAYAPGLAADPAATGSKWMLGWFEVDGSRASQTSALGGLTALVLPTEAGHPSLSADLLFLAQTESGVPAGLGRMALGSLTDLAGVTSFGDRGEYMVLGGGGPYATTVDPDLDPVESSYQTLTEAGAQTVGYASTRLAERAPERFVPGADRNPVGPTLTSGFVSGQGVSFRPDAPAGSRISEPYLLGLAVPSGLRAGFTPADNGVAFEMSGLRGVAGTGAEISGLALNWGGGDGRDAMLTDDLFVVRETAGVTGPITNQPIRLGHDPGRNPEIRDGRSEQTAFVGTIVSSGLAGDGGLLPDDLVESKLDKPSHLRWGWWAGEYRHAEADANPTDAGRIERMGVGAWVAGVQSSVISVLLASGTGTYVGPAVGNVIETTGAGTVSYLQGGRFEMSYNFKERIGTAHLSGIADQTLTATVVGATAASGLHYTADTLTGFNGPGSGSLRGVFYTAGGDPTVATGGDFDFNARTGTGNPAAVSGVFGADRIGQLTPP